MRPPARQPRRGNVLIEAVFALTALSALVFGAVEFGHFFYIKHVVQGASREGARAAIPGTATNTSALNAVTNAMTAAGFAAGKYTVTLSPANVATAAEGAAVTVTVTCTWGTVGVRPLGIIGSGKLVQGVTVMRKESS